MNQQFIQSLSIDWNKIEDDSYLREIEAINKLKEVVFENVPLCGFDKVYEIVEKYVDEGKIKRVYNISLGYIIYLDKKEEYWIWDNTLLWVNSY